MAITVSSAYVVGNQVRLSASFADLNGTPADPDQIICRVKSPAGTVTAYTYGTDAALIKDSTGDFHVDISVDVAGEWFYRFEGTGTIQAAAENSFIVRASEVI